MTLSTALRGANGVAAAHRIEELLATADRLITETGACNLTPFVLVERAALSALLSDVGQQQADLRRAHEAFTQMGATGRAHETTAELDRVAKKASD